MQGYSQINIACTKYAQTWRLIKWSSWRLKEFYYAIGRNRMQRRSSSTPQTLMLDHVLDGRHISLLRKVGR